jgi:hypothetical protein
MKKTIFNIAFSAFLVIFLFLGFNRTAVAQVGQSNDLAMPNAIWMAPNTDDFAAIQQQAEAWFEQHGTGETGKEGEDDSEEGSSYNKWKRWEYINQDRLTSDGKITNFSARNWDAYEEMGGGAERVTNGSWYFLAADSYTNGPSGYNPGIGRIGCIAFHPTDVNTLYVGLPSGGLWKTSNHGGSWTPLCDGLPANGVSGIAIDPSDANIIYILTGDGDAADTRSIGVLKSTNGGGTWAKTGLSWNVTDNNRGYKLMLDPANNNELWAVTTLGLYNSTDGGATWTNRIAGDWRDLEFRPGTSNTMYLSSSNTFYRSLDGGANWTQITSGLPTGEERVAIGVTPQNSNYVYVLCGPGGYGGSGTFRGLYLSTDGGSNFNLRASTPNILGSESNGTGSGNQSWYDLAIAVDRSNAAQLICGGVNTWRSVNSGTNWTNTSHWYQPSGLGYTHADIHALEINPLNNRLYCTSDGGVFYSDNVGTNWTDISSGIQPTQFYKIAGYPSNTNLIIGGTQDNGSDKYTGTSTFTHMFGADGMDCMIDYNNSNILYSSYQGGGLMRSADGGNSFFTIAPTSGPWVTPYMMHPTTSTTIYGGFYGGVYKSTNSGSTWSNTGGVSGAAELVHGVNDPNIIYASGGPTLYRSAVGGGSWTIISGGLPGYDITGIEIDHQDANQVWVTLAGYTAGQKVYKTENAAATTPVWTNISGTLPNTVVNCIETSDLGSDDAIYIGTDIGVFYRDAVLGDWMPFTNWLPTVMVFDLEINDAYAIITAGTYGRGLWRSSTYTDCSTFWSLSAEGNAGYSYYQASDYITATRTFTKGVGQQGIFKAANNITLAAGFRVQGGSQFKAVLGPCGAGVPGFNGVVQPVENIGPAPDVPVVTE